MLISTHRQTKRKCYFCLRGMNKPSETMVDILLRDLDSVVWCGGIQSRNQVTLLTSFLHFSCHEDEQDFAYFAKALVLLTQHF